MIPSDDRARIGRLVILTIGALLIGTPILSASASTITQAEWEQIALTTNPQSEGCFTMSYPSTTWSSETCAVSASSMPAVVGNGVGFIANATPKTIGETEGIIQSTSGFTSESDNETGTDAYSLQINSNHFTTNTSYTTGSVIGWQQFIYQNNGASGPGELQMQYWLLGYLSSHASCPTGPSGLTGSWGIYGDSCWNSYGPFTALTELPSKLDSLILEGITGQSGDDVVKMCDTSVPSCQSESFTDFLNLGTHWARSEFNVFGYSNGSRANFNTGISTDVEIHVWDGSGNPITMGCQVNGGYTAETNDMTLTSGSCSTGSGFTDFAESH
jgi:hypothetical protein